jgi:hypothetical protein
LGRPTQVRDEEKEDLLGGGGGGGGVVVVLDDGEAAGFRVRVNRRKKGGAMVRR